MASRRDGPGNRRGQRAALARSTSNGVMLTAGEENRPPLAATLYEAYRKQMLKLTGSIVKYPARSSFAWYLAVIALGTAALTLPVCHAPNRPAWTVIDAAFTATSATCVTGLSVRSTEHDLSGVGQAVVLLLIQLGGIGIMTVTTFAIFNLGGGVTLRNRAVLNETLGTHAETNLKWILRNIILVTLVVEGVGLCLLVIRNLMDQSPLAAAWHALFHSVSAFCNAGFSLHDDSMTRYQGDVVVNVTMCLLVVVGGLGFPVILDLLRVRHRPRIEWWSALHLHSKLMLIGTGSLITLGAASFLMLEWDNSLDGMSVGRKVLVSVFHSVSSRTAGFNTVSMGSLTNATLFVTVLLMMVGAGPCSTGGGFKVSTTMVLVCRAWSTFHGYARVNVFRRTIPENLINRAVATAMVFAVVAIVALTCLLLVEQSQQPHLQSQGLFLDGLFEIFSALGTVGLSTGLTPRLSGVGRVLIIVLMFMGRLGPISVFIALSRSQRHQAVAYPNEEPLIG